MIQSTANRTSSSPDPDPMASEPLDAHVVVLTNFMGPHHCRQMQACQQRVRRLTILLSTPMEPNRDWAPEWGDLDVRCQSSRMLTRKWRHTAGFTEDNYVHIPWDTGRQLRQLNPDVIFSYEMGLRTLFSSFYRATHRDCRLVMVCNVSEQTEQGRGKLRGWLRQWLRRRVDLVTSNGPGCDRYLRGQGYPVHKTMRFQYCHDAAKVWQGPRTFADPPYRLFYCGSFSERKGIVPFCHALVDWCRNHPDRNIEFALAGRGPLQLVIETMKCPANLEIKMLGSLDADAIRQCYGNCDMTVFPTYADEWGLVTNESLGSGTPILASCLAQSTEVLCVDGENSWLFDPRQRTSLDAALQRALNTPAAVMAKMSVAARQATAGISPRSSADEFYRIIRTALHLRHQ